MFIQEQIAPNYEKIKDKISLTFIPCGKSNSTTNTSGTFFVCQHGSFECEQNMFQSCALNLIGENMDIKTEFIICAMTRNPKPIKCALKTGLNVQEIHECATTTQGIKFQLKDEKNTAPIIAQSNHVPTIVFNGIWNYHDDVRAQQDLLSVVNEKI